MSLVSCLSGYHGLSLNTNAGAHQIPSSVLVVKVQNDMALTHTRDSARNHHIDSDLKSVCL